MAICQNIIGVSLAKLLNIKPLLGLTAGSMSMEGGHGNAAAYGKTLQDMGVDSAVAAAFSSRYTRPCIRWTHWRSHR